MKALFPLDGSEASYAALERGLKIIGVSKDRSATALVVLSKGLRDMPAEAREYLEFDDEDEIFIRDDEAKAVLEKARAIATRLKFTNFGVKAVAGQVKAVILAQAKEHTLLVMHGMRGTAREDKKHGNVVEELARKAGCDVLLVRAG